MTEDSGERRARAHDHREGSSVLVAISGELDAHSVPSLDKLSDELVSDGYVHFTFDMSQTTFIDSAGLRSLVSLQSTLKEKGGELVLRAPGDPVARLLRITGLEEHFSVT